MKKIILLLIVAGAFIACPKTTDPEIKFSLLISPDEQTVSQNSDAEFSVKIENVEDLFAFSVEIVFDQSIVEVSEDIVVGDFWSESIVSLSVIESGKLNVTIGLEQSTSDDGISGDGILFSFRILGTNIGESNITFENLVLMDEDGNSVSDFADLEIINGKIIVE